jgi:dolichyl-phosphate-mannose-protein mannosyltransferase
MSGHAKPSPPTGRAFNRNTLFSCAAIFVVAQILFLIGLGSPDQPYFDEVHYVAAARQLLAGQDTHNREHPPFAKELIAASIAVFGDDPLGWRYPSVFFGALALVGIYLWASQLFAEGEAALWATAITLLNQMLYVQARIAMLDVFMTAFIIWALVFFSASWHARRPRRWFAVCGACLGFAVASKWPGLIAWAMVAGIVLVVAVLKQWRTRFADVRASDWYRPDLWQEMRIRDWLLSLVVVPVVVYLLTFLPSGGVDLAALIRRQGEMWRGLASVPAEHPYLSHWFDWPMIRRPIWYLFAPNPCAPADRVANACTHQAVMLLGNPLVLWAGIPALLVSLHGWLMARRRDTFLIAASALSLSLAWAVLPKVGGYFYYYFPSVMVLGLALTYVFFETRLARWPWLRYIFLGATLALFIFFLPISSAAIGVTLPEYSERMWFGGWP